MINYPVDLWGCNLYLSIERRRGAKEPIIIVSNIALQNPFLLYRRRWEIETLFGCLKSRGFNIEDTHITVPDKIEKLLFVLAIAFCWAYRMGDIQDKVKPIEIKKHKRKARSLFRVGMDLIRRAFFNRVCLRKFRSLLTCFNISKPVSCVL